MDGVGSDQMNHVHKKVDLFTKVYINITVIVSFFSIHFFVRFASHLISQQILKTCCVTFYKWTWQNAMVI